jgi:hypothetical protein
MDLRDKTSNYYQTVLENSISFAEAHQRMGRVSLTSLAERREAAQREVMATLQQPSG